MKSYSVTQVTSTYADFSHVGEDVLAAAQERGTIVHLACANYARGVWSPVPPECRGYLHSFAQWFDSYVDKAISVEQEYRDEKLGIVGHPDLIAIVKGDNVPSLIDLKTAAAAHKLWRMQLAAYRHLCQEDYPTIERIFSLRLDSEGGPAKVREYTDNYLEDFAVFLSALNVTRWLDAA